MDFVPLTRTVFICLALEYVSFCVIVGKHIYDHAFSFINFQSIKQIQQVVAFHYGYCNMFRLT
jgi:hypothetical protein